MTNSGPSFRFPKREKLTGKKDIEELFKDGSSFYLRPLLIKYRRKDVSDQDAHRVLFTVSKRNFKRAVKRNLIKRRMREAYRLHKHLIHSAHIPFYQIAFVYIDKSLLPYAEIEDKLKSSLMRLQKLHLASPDKLDQDLNS